MHQEGEIVEECILCRGTGAQDCLDSSGGTVTTICAMCEGSGYVEHDCAEHDPDYDCS